jgi:hypothetical protein
MNERQEGAVLSLMADKKKARRDKPAGPESLGEDA